MTVSISSIPFSSSLSNTIPSYEIKSVTEVGGWINDGSATLPSECELGSRAFWINEDIKLCTRPPAYRSVRYLRFHYVLQ
jgi:hypothetical protein